MGKVVVHVDRNGNRYVPVSAIKQKVKEMADENANLRELVRELHAAYIGVVNRWTATKQDLITEYGGDTDEYSESEMECDEMCRRFDADMRRLGIESGE